MTAMRAPLALPVVQGTPEWLALRKTGIGSSDAPVIAGEFGSVVELWAEKTGLIDREEPDEKLAGLFEWGHRLEPVIADWYTDTTGRPLKRANRMLRHPDVPWAFASLDRVSATKGEKRIVELKTDRWGWKTSEPVPGRVQTQVQHQLWVTGYEVADIAVLVGGSSPRIIEIPRDDDFIDDLRFLEEEFWGWVQSKTRPPVDGSENARRVLSVQHPRNDGALLPASLELDSLAYRLRSARDTAKAMQDEVDTLENAVRAVIGDADGFEGPWGKITWKRNADSERTDWKLVAESLRRAVPDEVAAPILSLYTRTVEGPRVLRCDFRKGSTDD